MPWVTEMRYLWIYFVQSRKLKCSLDAAKRGFYRAANSIFSKIGRNAFEEVITNYFKQMRLEKSFNDFFRRSSSNLTKYTIGSAIKPSLSGI